MSTLVSQQLIPQKPSELGLQANADAFKVLTAVAAKLGVSAEDLRNEMEDETLVLMLKKAKLHLTDCELHKVLMLKHFNTDVAEFRSPMEFKTMALIVNNEAPVDTDEPIDPAYVAWAFEYFQHYDKDHFILFTDEVQEFVAKCFHAHGYIKVPKALIDFQDDLDRLNAKDITEQQDPELEVRIQTYVDHMKKEVLT